VIGAGVSSRPAHVSQPVLSGFSEGTWTTGNDLSTGEHYAVRVYAPQPAVAHLSRAGADYAGLPAGYRTILVPARAFGADASAQVVFPAFHSSAAVQDVIGLPVDLGASVVRASAYGPAYRLAQRLAGGAETPYGLVLAVERYLAHGYTYTQDPRVRPYPLESFLFRDKRGYCQQFAGAMALLLRMGGVPARVAVGFTPGRQVAGTQRWLVSDTDAHAWVEVWFPKFGWVKFDPTPPVDPALSGLAVSGPGAFSASVGSANQNNRHVAGATASKARAASADHSRTRSSAVTWETIAGAAAVVLTGLVFLWLATRPLDGPTDLVAELERALTRVGRPLGPGDTLTRIEEGMPGSSRARDYLRVLRSARFAGSLKLPTPAERRALRRQLALGGGPLGRLRALWALPPRRRRPRLGQHAANHAAPPPGA
jgi:hypothetical protein